MAMVIGCAASAQADLVTLLVDYVGNDGNGAVSTAADFLPNDAAIDSTATVNRIAGNPGDLSDVAGINIDATVQSSAGGNFTTTAGNNLGVPIYDSYNNTRRTPFLTLTVDSLEEFADGTEVTAIVYAIGDADNQDGNTTLTYDGVTSPVQFTDSNGNDTTNGFATFTFTKVDGVDSFTLDNAGLSEGSFRSFNGFSLTGTTAVPEPSSALAIAFAGGLGLLRRRRK